MSKKTEKKSILKRLVNKVNEKSGGTKLADYLGGKLAKKFSKNKEYVTETTTGKEALKSAGKVGLSVASVIGTGAIAGAIAKGVGKVGVKAMAKSKAKKSAVRTQEKLILKQKMAKMKEKAKYGKDGRYAKHYFKNMSKDDLGILKGRGIPGSGVDATKKSIQRAMKKLSKKEARDFFKSVMGKKKMEIARSKKSKK